MAGKKSKAAKRAGKNGAPHKGKGKGKKKVLSLTKGIGVVSCIEYPRLFRRQFKKGVGDPDVTIKFKHVLGYDDLVGLNAAIAKFNNDAKIGLIVTAGGLAAYEAAKASASKPFVSLVGAAPITPPNNFLGGVSLVSFEANKDRIALLVDKNHSKANICLFYNLKSKMKDRELDNWATISPMSPTVSGGNDGNGNNDSSTYKADFAGIGATTVTGVVISADPFFQDTMDDLIEAANDWVKGHPDRYVVYPLQDYDNKDPPPTKYQATLYGADLKNAYNLLGQQANNAITNNGQPVTVLKAPDRDTRKDLPPSS